MKEKTNKGITLIALVITIIILLILAAISIATLTGENGILKKVNTSKQKTEEATAREKLELSLLSASTLKYTTNEYNENEWLNEYVIAENPNDVIMVDEDIFTVNGWRFLVDRSVPKIVERLGETSTKPEITSIKVIKGEKLSNEWYITDIKIRVQGSGYRINNEDITLENGIREIVISEDGMYEITAYLKDEKGEILQQETLTVKKDTSKPDDFKPIDGIGNGTGKQIQISSKTSDLSGISEYKYYLNNEYIGTTRSRKIYNYRIRTICRI